MNKSYEFLAEVAKHYYLDSMSQSEIAGLYKLSRPTVANMLRECREKGIVEIRINDTSPFSSEPGKRLMERFGLVTACIVPNEADEYLTLYKTCLMAAEFLQSVIADRMRIGISWGTALYHTIRQLPKTSFVDCEVVEVMGGLGASALYYDGSELARMLAGKLNGRSFPFLSPMIVKTPELKDALLAEQGIRETVEKTENLDLILVGLSSDQPEESATVKAGFLSSEESKTIYDQGSCGHLCGYHYDAQGRFMDIPINKRVVAIRPEAILSVKRRVAIACTRYKSRAIHAALKGGLITDLFTDESAALQILSNAG